mmetsp:Transcript_2581/g.4887  ORF Transcript_2581/g.4887 Transcript_2581/m.4887 type:complete len:219 (+) Transcript_2581:572-1228(+)
MHDDMHARKCTQKKAEAESSRQPRRLKFQTVRLRVLFHEPHEPLPVLCRFHDVLSLDVFWHPDFGEVGEHALRRERAFLVYEHHAVHLRFQVYVVVQVWLFEPEDGHPLLGIRRPRKSHGRDRSLVKSVLELNLCHGLGKHSQGVGCEGRQNCCLGLGTRKIHRSRAHRVSRLCARPSGSRLQSSSCGEAKTCDQRREEQRQCHEAQQDQSSAPSFAW